MMGFGGAWWCRLMTVEIGDEFEVEVFVDLGSSGAALGAYQARLELGYGGVVGGGSVGWFDGRVR